MSHPAGRVESLLAGGCIWSLGNRHRVARLEGDVSAFQQDGWAPIRWLPKSTGASLLTRPLRNPYPYGSQNRYSKNLSSSSPLAAPARAAAGAAEGTARGAF